MACAVDPSPASGRQLAKQTSSTSVHSLETLLSTDSGVEQSAIGEPPHVCALASCRNVYTTQH